MGVSTFLLFHWLLRIVDEHYLAHKEKVHVSHNNVNLGVDINGDHLRFPATNLGFIKFNPRDKRFLQHSNFVSFCG